MLLVDKAAGTAVNHSLVPITMFSYNFNTFFPLEGLRVLLGQRDCPEQGLFLQRLPVASLVYFLVEKAASSLWWVLPGHDCSTNPPPPGSTMEPTLRPTAPAAQQGCSPQLR